MEDWQQNRLILEGTLLVVGIVGLGLGARALRRQLVNHSTGGAWWVPWVVVAVAVPFARRWLLDMDWVEEPVERFQEGVDSFPESLEDLDAINDWLYDFIVPLGVPGGFLIGYLVKTATVAAKKLLWAAPLALVGAVGLGIVYQFSSGEAESLGEAFGLLWKSLEEMWD